MIDPTNDSESAIPHSLFERIKQIDPDGNAFWSARDLMSILEYKSWQNFKNVLSKVRIACENSDHAPSEHLFSAVK